MHNSNVQIITLIDMLYREVTGLFASQYERFKVNNPTVCSVWHLSDAIGSYRILMITWVIKTIG